MLKHTIYATLAALTISFAHAQDVQEENVSPATKRYHELRQKETEPPFALAKVKAAIKALAGKDDEVIASPLWPKMSTQERFTYCMLHGELFSQNCSEMPWFVDEEKKVFSYPPPFAYGQEQWSKRQEAFLKQRRGAVVGLLRRTIRERGRVGVNLKNAIIEIKAVELIPELVTVYNRDRKDQDILSVLAVLMKEGGDKAFRASPTWHKLYGPEANYKSFIVANEANQKLMVARAMAFYHRRVG